MEDYTQLFEPQMGENFRELERKVFVSVTAVQRDSGLAQVGKFCHLLVGSCALACCAHSTDDIPSPWTLSHLASKPEDRQAGPAACSGTPSEGKGPTLAPEDA